MKQGNPTGRTLARIIKKIDAIKTPETSAYSIWKKMKPRPDYYSFLSALRFLKNLGTLDLFKRDNIIYISLKRKGVPQLKKQGVKPHE